MREEEWANWGVDKKEIIGKGWNLLLGRGPEENAGIIYPPVCPFMYFCTLLRYRPPGPGVLSQAKPFLPWHRASQPEPGLTLVWLGLRPNERTNERTNKKTENLPVLLVVWARPIVKSRMQSLCHVNLSHLSLPTLYHPSGTTGDPLPAPKRPETRPKTTHFPNHVVGDVVGGVDNASSPPTTFNPVKNIPIPPYQNALPPLGKLWTSNKFIFFLVYIIFCFSTFHGKCHK